jgi:hypothetical protein
VNAGPAAVAEAVGAIRAAEVVRPAGAVGLADAVVVIGAGPVGVGVAEHAADSVATAHSAATATAARAGLLI